jgi:hypothetical protein
MADFQIVGQVTPNAVVFKSESHKLHHSFPLATGKKVVQGQLVVLNTDGTVQGFTNTDSLAKVIGYAVTNSDYPAYGVSRQHGPVDITVAVKGYGIIYGVSGAALNAGDVKPNGLFDSTAKYAQFVQAGAGDMTATPPVLPDRVHGIALNPATDAGELIHVMIL